MISFVCTTYRRFFCVERIIAQFFAQTYKDAELIIFNTDMEYPMELHQSLYNTNIRIINNGIDYQTNKLYTNRGDICRDAVTHAKGDYFMLADDDDIYLPWHLQQAIDQITLSGKDAWKPAKSFFATKEKIDLVQNTMEASVIVKMNRIREIGFRNDLTGYEGLSWYTKLRDEGQLNEHEQKYVPSYCFNWSDPANVAGHKQSGDINNPNNFDNHKLRTNDFAWRSLVAMPQDILSQYYKPYVDFIRLNKTLFDEDLLNKYVTL